MARTIDLISGGQDPIADDSDHVSGGNVFISGDLIRNRKCFIYSKYDLTSDGTTP